MWQVLQSEAGITKWDRYYKVWQVLQSVTGIAKWDRYYKVRKILQCPWSLQQSVTDITSFELIAKCDDCYKVIQVYYKKTKIIFIKLVIFF